MCSSDLQRALGAGEPAERERRDEPTEHQARAQIHAMASTRDAPMGVKGRGKRRAAAGARGLSGRVLPRDLRVMRRFVLASTVLLSACPRDLPPAPADAAAEAAPDAEITAPCAAPAGTFAPLSARCGNLVDGQGRSVVLFGVNARVEGVFDVDLGPGRVPLQAIPPFTREDARRMRAAGFNVYELRPDGSVSAVADGATRVVVTVGDERRAVEVVVSGAGEADRVDFDRDVLPAITRAGCNAGSCHASQYGKGGFVLSVMAFDAPLDHTAMAIASQIGRAHV